jgi:hypothetical protein
MRHIAAALGGKRYSHGRIVAGFRPGHVAQLLLDDRMPLLLEHRQGECHVLRGDLRAIVEARSGRNVKR